jgi:hypothetical protein
MWLMKLTRSLVALLAISLVSAIALLNSPVAFATAMPFTAVQLQSLDQSNRVRLPLTNQYAFIAVGFHPDRQPQLEQALLIVRQLSSDKLKIMEIPVIDQNQFPDNALVRNFMKLRIRNKQLTAHVYPYFTQLRQVQARLGLKPDQHALFLLLNDKGHIQWKKTTPPTEKDLIQIKELLG